MSKLKSKLDYLNKDKIKTRWDTIDSQQGLSTREKLEKLVKTSLKKEEKMPREKPVLNTREELPVDDGKGYTIREFSYPLTTAYGRLTLVEWKNVSPEQLAVISGEEKFLEVSPMKLLFFDTETTGLSGGTGTIPFMLGFGFFDEGVFRVKVFILNDLNREDEFLDRVDLFLGEHEFSGTVTYNGKVFDFPLME
ncbi:MAG: hypothetical protein GY950_16975, partial [bacterium]|nr:hypothetical protein [bacterium]